MIKVESNFVESDKIPIIMPYVMPVASLSADIGCTHAWHSHSEKAGEKSIIKVLKTP